MRFDYNAAIQAGYTDEEIAQHLGSKLKFDALGALESGYSFGEVLDHLKTRGLVIDSAQDNAVRGQTMARLREYDNAVTGDGKMTRRAETEGMDPRDLREERRQSLSPKTKRYVTTTDAWGNIDGGLEVEERGERDPSIRINETDLPDSTFVSKLHDAVAASVNIVPTAAKGVTDIARMVTGDADWARGASNWIERQKLPYSERGELQKGKFEQDMADPNVSVLDTLTDNKAALLDMGIETVGSMLLPTGVAIGVVKAAGGIKAWQALSAVDRAARLERAAKAASISTAAVQNAADTFATIRDDGGSLGDAYKGAAISGAASMVAGKLTDGGIEKVIASRLATKGLTEAGERASTRAQAIFGVGKNAIREGVQEVGEEVGAVGGEVLGGGMAFDPQSAGKRLAVAGTLGTALGGAGDVATGGLAVQKPAGSPPEPVLDYRGAVEARGFTTAETANNSRDTGGQSGGSAINFTPPGSPTQQAGLQDIVIPLPDKSLAEQKAERKAKAEAEKQGPHAGTSKVVEQTPADELLKRIPVLDENGAPVPNPTAEPPAPAAPLGDAAVQTDSASTPPPAPEQRANWRGIPISRRNDAELELSLQMATSPRSRANIQAEIDRRAAARPQSFAPQQPAVQPGLAAPSVRPTGTTPTTAVQTPPVSPTTTPTAAPAPATAVAPTATAAPTVNVAKVRERLTQIFGKDVADTVSLVNAEQATATESSVGERTEGFFAPEAGANVVLDNIGKRNNTKLDNDELATWVGTHEVLHSGAFQQMQDKGLKRDAEGYTTTLRAAETNPLVSKIAAQKNGLRGVAVEEALVEIGAAIETGNASDLKARYGVTLTPAATGKVKPLVDSLMDFARRVMRRVGINKDLSDSEIRAILKDWKVAGQKFASERKAGVKHSNEAAMFSRVEAGPRTAAMRTADIRGSDLTRSQMNRAVRFLKGKNNAVYRNIGLRLRAGHDTKGSWRQGMRDDIAGMIRSGTIPRTVIDPGYREPAQSIGQRLVESVRRASSSASELLRNRNDDTRERAERETELRSTLAPIPTGKDLGYYEARVNAIWRAVRRLPGFPQSNWREQRAWWEQNHPTSMRVWRKANEQMEAALSTQIRRRDQARVQTASAPVQLPDEILRVPAPPRGVQNPSNEQIKERGIHAEYAFDNIRFSVRGQPSQSSQGGVLQYVSTLEGRGFDLFNAISQEESARLITGWKKILAHDSAFKFKQPGSDSREVMDIARDMGLVDMGYNPRYEYQIDPLGGTYHAITLTNPTTGRPGIAHLEETRMNSGRAFVAHTASLNRDGLGTAWYQLAAAYALKANVPIYPDGILLDINKHRRTEQMLASAARNGGRTTMIPGRSQRVYGFTLPQSDVDHQRNFVRLLLANLRNVEELFPALKHVEYDHATDKFKFRDPTVGSDEQAEALVNSYTGVRGDSTFPGDPLARDYGLGRTTVARAAITAKLLRGEPVTNVAPRKAVMYSDIEDEPYFDPDAIEEQAELNYELSKEDIDEINRELNSLARRGRPDGAPDPNGDYNYSLAGEKEKYAGTTGYGIGEENSDMDIIDRSMRPNFVWGTFDPREDLYDSIPADAAERIVNAWRKIAARTKSFKFGGRGRIAPFPAVDAKKMQELAEKMGIIDHLRRDVKSDIYSLRVQKLLPSEARAHNGTSGFRIVFLDENGAAITNRTVDISYRPEENDESDYLSHNGYRINVPHYVVHSIKLEQGSGVGTAVYQLLGAYADRSGVIIAPDRGLTPVNQYRRTEQQISIALRTGKPTLMLPGTNQRVYKFNASASTPEEHAKNFVRLIVASTRNWQRLAPEIFNLRYDAKNDTFTDLDGGYADDIARDLIKQHLDKGMGRATLARAVINQQLLEGKRVGQPKKPLLYSEITDSVYNGDEGATDGRRDQTADARAQTGSSEPPVRSGRGSAEGTRRAVEVVGVHYSHDKRTILYGNKFGTGIQGREQARVAQSSDPRIKRRVYFYIQNEDGVLPKKEGGLGVWAHRAALGNLFEAGVSPALEIDTKSKDGWPLSPGERANRFESAVLDAGYDGYVYRGGNVAVVMNKDVPVEVIDTMRRSDIDADRRGFQIPKETWLQRQRRKVQDFMLRVRVVEDAIAAQGGSVNDRTSVYRAFERLPGRIQSEMVRFRDEFLKPLSEKLARDNLTYDELALYAYAKHAKERNTHIQSINPKFRGTNGGSGMTDDQADMILQIFDQEGLTQKMEALHRDLMALTETTRRVLLDEGLIDQESYDNWTSLYQNYVPLRGFENIEVDEQGIPKFRTGRGINVRGEESVRALGRRSEAGQIIENIILDYERAIIRTERNAAARVLADLVLNNPDPKLWEINAERRQRSFDKQRHAVVTTYVTDKGEDTVGLKINGQPVYIKIKDPLLARALRQSFMDESGQFQRAIYESLGWYTDFMRNTLTRYNPGFMLVNGIRDFETGSVSVLDKLGAKAVAKYTAHYKGALAASWRYERSKLDPQARAWDKWFREYADAGGITGGFFMRDADAVMDELRAEVLDAGGSVAPKGRGMQRVVDKAWIKTRGSRAGKLAAKTLRAVEMLGSMSENASRVAAYRTAREMGKSPAEASRIAKNLTTNFNRKGEWGTALSSLYLFFNAAMQGGVRVLYALKNPKVQAAMAGFTGLTMALALANADWGGEDDDGVKFWDKLSDDEKERNLIIMLPPKDKRARYIKIPMAYGYNVFAVLGNAFADSLRYTQNPKHGKPYLKSAINMVSAVMGSFNPVAGSFDPRDPKKLALAVSPTAGDLAINIATETNSFGEPSAPEKDDRYPRPDSERFFISQAGTTEQRIARWMNSVSGGNQAQSGSVDVVPSTINTVVRGATGGTGQFVMDVFNTLAQLTDSTQDVNPKNVPFFKSLHGTSDERLTSRQFYANQREIAEDYRQLMMAMKSGIKVDFEDPKNRALVMVGKHMDAVGEQLTNIRKWEIQVVEDPKLTDKEKELKRKEIRAVREKLMQDYNRQFSEVWGKVR